MCVAPFGSFAVGCCAPPALLEAAVAAIVGQPWSTVRRLLEAVATEHIILIKMPRPGMVSPQWNSLARLCSGSFDDAVVATIDLQTNILIVTAGAQWPRIPALYGLRILDVRPFFRLPEDRRDETISCKGKTSFHAEVYSSYLGSGVDRAVEEVVAEVSPDLLVYGRTVCMLWCDHGLHRSQAVARRVGEYFAWRGYTTCVLNAATFSRRWLYDYRAFAISPPAQATFASR